MKTKFITSILAGVLALSGIAQADGQKSAWCPNCWYVSGFAGPAWHREMSTSLTITGQPTSSFITDYKTGYDLGGSIGAVFCRSWRLEAEFAFRTFRGDRVIVGPLPLTSGQSADISDYPYTRYRSFSIMANGFYDFCLCETVSWYVGGGIGPSWVEYKIRPSAALGGPNAKNDKVRFSYQIMTGIAYRLCNNISLTVGYRLWGTTKGKEYDCTVLSADGTTTSSAKIKDKRAPIVNSLEFGLRYAF